MYEKSNQFVYISLASVVEFSKLLGQGVPFKAANQHALSQEQYFSKSRILDICQCAFKNIFCGMPFRFYCAAQKLKFSIKDFFSKCDQIRRKLRIWSHLLKKSLMESFIFCVAFICQKAIFNISLLSELKSCCPIPEA